MATPFYYPQIGGAEISTENLAIQLNARNIITDVMTFNKGFRWNSFSERIIHGIKVIGIPALNLQPLKFPELLFQIQFLPRKFTKYFENYDIIHFQNDIDLSFPVFSCNVIKPKVIHCRCLAGGMFRQYKRNPVSQRLFLKSAHIFIVLSEEFVKYLINLGIPAENIRVVPNGIDIEKFRPGGEKIENMLLFVGRLDPVKGLHILLQALNYITTPIQLVIIGGPSWHRDYSERVLNLIAETSEKTFHKIVYLGHLKRDQIVKWYQKASIHIRPDIYGISGGNTTLESMACGTPIIGTGNHLVKNGVNGMIVPPNNVIKLVKAIEFLVNNKDVRQKFGKESIKFVEENLSFKVITEKIIQVYKETMISSRARSKPEKPKIW